MADEDLHEKVDRLSADVHVARTAILAMLVVLADRDPDLGHEMIAILSSVTDSLYISTAGPEVEATLVTSVEKLLEAFNDLLATRGG